VKTYIKYVESQSDTDICCVDCAKEYGFKTAEETDAFNYKWYKSHFEERIGKKITDEEWAVYYPKLRKELNKTDEKLDKTYPKYKQ
jgi:hypothetical protein